MIPYPKIKTPRSREYLDWLKTQQCVICGRAKEEYRDIVPAHQTINGHGFMGGKANDFHALPMCSFCHAEGHLLTSLIQFVAGIILYIYW